jgi:hypothetical protein
MRRFKLAAIAVGVVIALFAVSSVIGLLIWAAMGALVIGTVVLGIEVAFRRGQVSRRRQYREVGEPGRDQSLRRPAPPGVDDELARLRREMGR